MRQGEGGHKLILQLPGGSEKNIWRDGGGGGVRERSFKFGDSN